MLRNIKKNMITSLVMLIAISGLSFADVDFGAAATNGKDEFTLEEMLNYALEDEYLAFSEYEIIIAELDASTPFTNIIKAEKTHISLLEPLFEKYKIDLPKVDASANIVSVSSLDEAYKAGIKAEIDNIAMYDKFLQNELDYDVRNVFERLKSASESHLKAFERQVDRINNSSKSRRGFGGRF